MKLKNIIISLLLFSAFQGKTQTVKRISLSEALAMAAKGNKQVQIQMLEEIRQKEFTKEVRSQLLPSVTAGGNYLHYFDRQVIFLPGSFAGTTKPVQDIGVGGKQAFNGWVAASQPLLNEAARKQVKAALYDEKIQREKTADLKSNLGEQISISYFNMLLMQSQINLQQQSLLRNEKALRDTRSLFAQGRSLKADTLRAFIAVENLRSAISYLHNNLEVAGIHLKKLIGIDNVAAIELSDTLTSEVPAMAYELGDAIETAGQMRKDITVRQLLTEKSKVVLAAAKAAQLPQLSAIGQYPLQAQADHFKLGQYVWPPTSFAGLQINVPIFSGSRIKSRISQANVQISQEAIGLEDLQHTVKSELAALLLQWREANEQLHIQKRTVELAMLSYDMMDDRYRNGLSTRLELADAELALTQSKINYLQAVYNQKVIQVQLKRAQGLLKLQ